MQPQKVRLQSGKKAWGVVNDAAVVHEFHYDLHMAMEDIAAEMQISGSQGEETTEILQMYLEYTRSTGDTNEKRFAFQRSAAKVIEWVDESPRTKIPIYVRMTPTNAARPRLVSVL